MSYGQWKSIASQGWEYRRPAGKETWWRRQDTFVERNSVGREIVRRSKKKTFEGFGYRETPTIEERNATRRRKPENQLNHH